MGILIFIIVLLVLIVVHELGHYFAAKSYNVRVDEFGVGYPPKAKTLFKHGETKFTLNWIPFGGFVKIFGENPNDESINGKDSARSLVHKPRYQQAVVLVAGIVFNLFFAWALFSWVFMIGAPSSISNTVNLDSEVVVLTTEPNSPASDAGLQPGDRLNAVRLPDGSEVTLRTLEDLKLAVQQSEGNDMEFIVGEEGRSVIVSPRWSPQGVMIGAGIDSITPPLGIGKSIVHGANATLRLTIGTATGFAHLIGGLFTGTASSEALSGPVGIATMVDDVAEVGFSYLLAFSALISINLAIINLFPFPALDGGRLLFLGIEAIRQKRMNPRAANIANGIGFFALIVLMIFITVKDILRLV